MSAESVPDVAPLSWCVDMFSGAVDVPAYIAGRRAQRLCGAHAFVVNGYLTPSVMRHFNIIISYASRKSLLTTDCLTLGFHQDEVVKRLQQRVGSIVDVESDKQVDCLQVLRVRRGDALSLPRDQHIGSVFALMFLNSIEGASVSPVVIRNGESLTSYVRPSSGTLLLWRQNGTTDITIPAVTSSLTSRWMICCVIRPTEIVRLEEPAPLLAPVVEPRSLIVHDAVAREPAVVPTGPAVPMMLRTPALQEKVQAEEKGQHEEQPEEKEGVRSFYVSFIWLGVSLMFAAAIFTTSFYAQRSTGNL